MLYFLITFCNVVSRHLRVHSHFWQNLDSKRKREREREEEKESERFNQLINSKSKKVVINFSAIKRTIFRAKSKLIVLTKVIVWSDSTRPEPEKFS